MNIAKSLLSRRGFAALAGAALIATAMPVQSFAADVTIPIIVKDTTSFYWQIVLAGARQAGKDLGRSLVPGVRQQQWLAGEVQVEEAPGSPSRI